MTWRDEIEDSRRERVVEVAFWREHPYGSPTGERLAAQFVALLTEQAKIFELTNDPKTLPKAERAALARFERLLDDDRDEDGEVWDE